MSGAIERWIERIERQGRSRKDLAGPLNSSCGLRLRGVATGKGGFHCGQKRLRKDGKAEERGRGRKEGPWEHDSNSDDY